MSDTQVKELNAVGDLKEFQAAVGGPGWLGKIRSIAAERFAEKEWPSTSEEEWRRTSLRAFEFDAYHTAPSPTPTTTAQTAADQAATNHAASASDSNQVPDSAGQLLFSNGSCVSSQLDDGVAAEGVVFSSLLALDSATLDGPDKRLVAAALKAVKATLQKRVKEADNRLVLWQLALLRDAAVLYLPRGQHLDKPLVIDFGVDGDELAVSQQVIIIAEDDCSATVVKRVTSGSDGEVLLLDGEELTVGANSGLRFTTIQALNDESIVFHHGTGAIERDGRLHRTEVQLGSDFVKTRFAANLVGKGGDAALNGLYYPTDENHMDIRTVQGHHAARTSSRAYYRSAVQGESHGIYQGLITVAHEAVGTDAYLTSKNLILSEDARADSIPSLNIATDDVRCSHGSTTGKIDETQIFYLQTRGYSRGEARLALIEGYFEDLIAQTPAMVQEQIRELVAARINDQGE